MPDYEWLITKKEEGKEYARKAEEAEADVQRQYVMDAYKEAERWVQLGWTWEEVEPLLQKLVDTINTYGLHTMDLGTPYDFFIAVREGIYEKKAEFGEEEQIRMWEEQGKEKATQVKQTWKEFNENWGKILADPTKTADQKGGVLQNLLNELKQKVPIDLTAFENLQWNAINAAFRTLPKEEQALRQLRAQYPEQETGYEAQQEARRNAEELRKKQLVEWKELRRRAMASPERIVRL